MSEGKEGSRDVDGRRGVERVWVSKKQEALAKRIQAV